MFVLNEIEEPTDHKTGKEAPKGDNCVIQDKSWQRLKDQLGQIGQYANELQVKSYRFISYVKLYICQHCQYIHSNCNVDSNAKVFKLHENSIKCFELQY